MHRSGTSCLAGMLAAGGLASAGDAVRNWDNARGHFEMLDAVRLNEAVLAYSGGHWLSPPAEVRWTDEHAAARDRILSARIETSSNSRDRMGIENARADRARTGIDRAHAGIDGARSSIDRAHVGIDGARTGIGCAHVGIDGARTIDRTSRPALIKDPRTLLVLPFWRASAIPFHTIAIVRHPLATARSLESWRATPIDEGIALWRAHNEALRADRARHDYALLDFDAPRDVMIAHAIAAARSFAKDFDEDAFAGAYEDLLVHHDGHLDIAPDIAPDTAPGIAPGIAPGNESSDARNGAALRDALALHAELVGSDAVHRQRSYPRASMRAFTAHLDARDHAAAIAGAREALASIDDASAVLVPIVTSLVRHRAFDDARALIDEHAARLENGMADLLRAKVLLGANDAVGAVAHLERAIAVPNPFHQVRHLLPEALRRAGRLGDARTALENIVSDTLYPHGPLSTLAEWSWLDGEHARALDEMARAIDVAPPNRRGRLRTRRAEWLIAHGDAPGARAELEHAIAEDPAYTRSRDVLARVPR
jgi:tetratricopeptide (TPR) repeat protein